jgi:hypothetical protein
MSIQRHYDEVLKWAAKRTTGDLQAAFRSSSNAIIANGIALGHDLVNQPWFARQDLQKAVESYRVMDLPNLSSRVRKADGAVVDEGERLFLVTWEVGNLHPKAGAFTVRSQAEEFAAVVEGHVTESYVDRHVVRED